MKKIKWTIIALLGVLVVLGGCSQQADAKATDVSEEATSEIDVDLTQLSSVMVYSEVFNMVNTPDDYYGKTVKMRGIYSSSYYEETDQYYHFVIIEDATACCEQGLEFIWMGDHTYPGDYPEDGEEVEIVGVYGSYEELGVPYNFIETENLTVIS